MVYKLSNLNTSLGFHYCCVRPTCACIMNLFSYSSVFCCFNPHDPATEPKVAEEVFFPPLQNRRNGKSQGLRPRPGTKLWTHCVFGCVSEPFWASVFHLHSRNSNGTYLLGLARLNETTKYLGIVHMLALIVTCWRSLEWKETLH